MSSHLRKTDRPVKWIRCKDLDVKWTESQRQLNVKKVTAIAKDLNPDALGVLTVARIPTKKGEDRFHMIDGQHRKEAVEQLYGANEMVPCQIIEGAGTPEEAAEIWLDMNTERTRPNTFERFKVAVTAGRELECAVNEIIKASPFEVRQGSLTAVAACLTVYKKIGGPGLEWVLNHLAETWGPEKESVQGALILGYGLWYERFVDQTEPSRLMRKVATRYTANSLVGAGRNARDMFGGSLASGILRILVTSYNYKLREENQLVV